MLGCWGIKVFLEGEQSDLALTQSHDLLQALALGISNSRCFRPLIPGDLKFFTAEKPCGQ